VCRLLATLSGVLLVLVASEARADIVVFRTGRTMSVASCRVEGDQATLVLREGGEVVFPSALIARIAPDEVPYPQLAAESERAAGQGDEAISSGRDHSKAQKTRVGGPGLAARPFGDLIADVAAREGVDARLVHAVVEVESAYQPRARSPKGATGLMQLMPATARQYAVRDPYDPRANLEAGVRHLKRLLGRFDLSLALAAYNAGEAVVKQYGGLPPFPETQRYVRSVLERVGR
jgi:soluble lytic murein transglycosylase-like protein